MKIKAWISIALLALAGCAAREIKVECNGKLQPINAPAAKASP